MRFRFVLAVLAGLSLLPAAAHGQQADSAIIVGVAVDSTQGPLPGASVTVTNTATNVSTSVVTNERGQYRTPPLRIGIYDVAVEFPGFKRSTAAGRSCSTSATSGTWTPS